MLKMKNIEPISFEPTQKEAICLLSVGTFLEYFDLMLYVHMSILLNELFFPKTDPYTASLISAFAFCSTYVMRPFGALLFGWVTDNKGRKTTIILTTSLMSLSSLFIAILPTYAQIGILASIAVTICRVVQGIASMSEMVAAEIYLTETTKPPKQYLAVSSIDLFGTIGALCALCVASYSVSSNFNWRYAFLFGAFIAGIGMVARIRLKESPEFLKAKSLKKKNFRDVEVGVSIKTCFAMFCIQSSISPYICFIFCGNILLQQFGFTSQEVIYQNLFVALIGLCSRILLLYLCVRIYPLILLKIFSIITIIFLLFLPYLLHNMTSSFELFLIQAFLSFFIPSSFPAGSIFYKYFPVTKRFTYSATIFACAKAIMSVIASFGLVYLIQYFNNYYAIWLIILPIYLCFYWAVLYFAGLEQE